MSQTTSSESAVSINHPHVYTQNDQFLISIPMPEDIAAICAGLIRDKVHEGRYDEMYYSPDGSKHLNITGVGVESVEKILDVIDNAADEIQSYGTVARLTDGRVLTTDHSLIEDGVLNTAAHKWDVLSEELGEVEFWEKYLEKTS